MPAPRFDDDALTLGIRHHRRALAALIESGQFDSLATETRGRLIAQLQTGLDDLETKRQQATTSEDRSAPAQAA